MGSAEDVRIVKFARLLASNDQTKVQLRLLQLVDGNLVLHAVTDEWTYGFTIVLSEGTKVSRSTFARRIDLPNGRRLLICFR